MRSSRALFWSMALYWAAGLCRAEGICDRTSQEYRDCVRYVDSLRPDKAGQMRVFAADGSEFNAGQVLWMKARLRKFERLCASGASTEQTEAAQVLTEVLELLKAHRRNS